MNTQEMIDRYRKILEFDLESPIGYDASDEDIVKQLNQGIETYGDWVEDLAYARVVTVAANDYLIDALSAIGSDVRDIRSLYIDGHELERIASNEFHARYPNFAYSDPARPSYWTKDRDTRALLSSRLSADVAARSWTARVAVRPPLLSVGSLDFILPIPQKLHVEVVRLAAASAAIDYARNSDQAGIAQNMYLGAEKAIKAYGADSLGDQAPVINPEFHRPTTWWVR